MTWKTIIVIGGVIVNAAAVLAGLVIARGGGLPIGAPLTRRWVIANPNSDMMRAIHMAGNWGPNEQGWETLPNGYFRWLPRYEH